MTQTTTPTRRLAVRPVLSEQLQLVRQAEQFTALALYAPRGADRSFPDRLLHRIQLHVNTLQDLHRQRQLQQRQCCRRRPAGAGGATFPSCRGSTTRRCADHYMNASRDLAYRAATRSAAPTRSTTTLQTRHFPPAALSWRFTTRSAAASTSSTRPTTLPATSGFAVPQDRRFNLSFTLAGIGTFSNFFGAFGGRRRPGNRARLALS